MPSVVATGTLAGLDAILVEVEAEVLPGLPSVTVVGLPDAAIREARERITAAIVNSGFTPPRHRTIISLAPAHVRKAGGQLDLPIALAYLIASGQCKAPEQPFMVIGSLGLSGDVRSVDGGLAFGERAKQRGVPLIAPPATAQEAVLAGAETLEVSSLKSLIAHICGETMLPSARPLDTPRGQHSIASPDLASVAGHEHVKRALEVAASGGHNILMHGPPGSGKSFLARAFAGILPPLSADEAFEVTKIHSVKGVASEGGLMRERPFRAPHHSSSAVSLIGGGSIPAPGEVTLAHRGVLFLDEFAEFPRMVLDQLRQPLEEGEVSVSRAAGAARFPARFALVAAMNPCLCGYAGDERRACTCAPGDVARYQRRVSGPLLDRIDLHVHVPSQKADVVLDRPEGGEPSRVVRERVARARARQHRRLGEERVNAAMDADEVRTYSPVVADARGLLIRAADSMSLSSRAIHRTIKVAATIADLDESDEIRQLHIAEALQYRAPLPGG